MGVIGEADVKAAAAAGRRELVVTDSDILTPQGRDVASQFGMRIVPAATVATTPPRRDHATAVRRVLFRRSPKWITPTSSRREGQVLDKVAIIGSGAVGAATGHLLAMNTACSELAMIDIVGGLAASTALDIEHASGISGSPTKCRGGSGYELIDDADVVIITAGRPRSPGQKRADLATQNAEIVRQASEAISEYAPRAVIIVVTNPLDEMAYTALVSSGFPRERVLGMAGTLDSSRFRWALARAADVSPADVEAFTLGSHGDEMVPVVSRATIKDRRVAEILDTSTIERCVRETVDAGARIVELRQTGSASIAPAHAIGEVVGAIRGAITEPVPVSVYLKGEYGIDGSVVGVPAKLGPGGLVEVIQIGLTAPEERALREAAEVVKKRINELRR